MKVSIISPASTKIYQVDWIELNTLDGNFVIHDGFAPTVFILQPQKPLAFQKKDSREVETFIAPHGIAKITRESALILLGA